MSFHHPVWKITPRVFQPWWTRLQASPVGYRIARGTFWSLAGTVISRALGLAASVVVARLLGKHAFGELGMIQSTVELFSTLAGMGMGLTATKHVAESRVQDPARSGRILALSRAMAWGGGALMTIGLIACAPWLAGRTLAAPHLTGMIQLAAPLLLLGAINGVQIGALNGFEAFQAVARINLVSGLAAFPLTIAGVLLWGLPGVFAASLATAALRCLLCQAALRKVAAVAKVPLAWAGFLQERVVLWRFALPATLSGMVLPPALWAANVLLVNGPFGYGGMATLGAANQWRNLVMFVPNIVMQAVLPVFASSVGEGERSGSFQRTLSLTQGTMVLTAFPVCAALMFFSDWLMRLYWKAGGAESHALILCVFASLVQCLGAATGPALQARSKMWLGVAFNVSWAAVYTGVSAALVGSLGATALALGQAVAYVVLTVWGFLYMKPELPEGMLRRVFLGLLVACTLAGICLAVPPSWRTWLGIPMTLGASALAVGFLIEPKLRQALLVRPCA
ncbi:MAG: oligosaccharide flippase family protein [Verrucomicrobiia bacterium]